MRHFKDGVESPVPTHRPIPRSEAGLTLIEMMIVLVIIAVVSGMIVMSGILGRPDEARATAAKSGIATLKSALAIYRLDNGDYPTADQGLRALAVKPNPAPPAWRPYVQEEPKDPWGRDYIYAVTDTSFTITSLGKDGKPGGEGVDADIVGQGQ